MVDPHETGIYGESDERPPWMEEAAAPTWWDLAFGSFGDGYLEWVNSRYFWSGDDPRRISDTRTLWADRHDYDESGASGVSGPSTATGEPAWPEDREHGGHHEQRQRKRRVQHR